MYLKRSLLNNYVFFYLFLLPLFLFFFYLSPEECSEPKLNCHFVKKKSTFLCVDILIFKGKCHEFYGIEKENPPVGSREKKVPGMG